MTRGEALDLLDYLYTKAGLRGCDFRCDSTIRTYTDDKLTFKNVIVKLGEDDYAIKTYVEKRD